MAHRVLRTDLYGTSRRHVKIVVVGPGAAGKSWLCYRFADRKLPDNVQATIGASFFANQMNIDGEMVNVQIWDTAGQQMFLDTLRMYFRNAYGVVIVYDITDNKNFLQAEDWLKYLGEFEDFRNSRKIIVGNKCDIKQYRQVSSIRGYQLAAKYGANFFEVSAKTCESVEKSFDTLLKDIVADVNEITDNRLPGEFLNDPYALSLYQEALKAGREKDKSIRINIVGNYGQGKTSLTRRLVGEDTQKIESTNGITVERYKCLKGRDGRCCYDKAIENNKPDYIERLVQAAVNYKLEDEGKQNKPTSSGKAQETNGKLLYAEPAKHDTLPGQTMNTQPASNAPKEYSASGNSVVEESASKKSINLSAEERWMFTEVLQSLHPFSEDSVQTAFDIWDFGGQYVFYATHSIFHSRNAIYLLVFDLTLDFSHIVNDNEYPTDSEKRDVKYFLEFWMNSIHSYVGSTDGCLPTVILVGTHKDQIKGNQSEREAYIKRYFNDVRQLFDDTPMLNHIYFEDFAVDNSIASDVSVISLRDTINKIGEEQSETKEIPVKWVQLEKSLNDRKHLKLILLKFVLAIDAENEFPLGEIEQVKLFLRYHHAKGTYIFFDDESVSEYVVLDPQYLIDAFKAIITSRQFCTNDPDVRPFWKLLLTEGRLEEGLIDKQWGNSDNANQMFMENKKILLSFLVKHHIISEAAVFDENTKLCKGLGWYVVPSLLRGHSSQTEIQDFLEGKRQTQLRFLLLFNSSPILSTVYHRLISAAIGRWPVANYGKKTLIFKDVCILRMNIDHAAMVQMKNETIELTVVNLCPTNEVDAEQADLFRRFSEAVISFEFGKLRSPEETVIKPVDIRFRCNHESHGIDGSENIISWNDLIGRSLVPCPDLKTHEIVVNKAKGQWFQDFRAVSNVPVIHLTDKLLGQISQCIGDNWQLLGIELGLTNVQLQHIIEDHRSTVSRIYIMLQKWCQQEGDKATLKSLIEGMKHCPNVSVEWDNIRNILDDFN